jgi:putative transposase
LDGGDGRAVRIISLGSTIRNSGSTGKSKMPHAPRPKFDPQKHHRRSIRLKGYDYSSEGAYYVTIVTQGRECLFGEIVNGEMRLNEYGEIVQKWWNEIPIHFPTVELGVFVIMPNHVHGIIFITTERRGEVISAHGNPNNNFQDAYVDETFSLGGETPLRKRTLGQIVAYFKYQSTKEMNRIETEKAITKFWQRNYYEHIIRDEKDLQSKTDYIKANPSLWDDDENNPPNDSSS